MFDRRRFLTSALPLGGVCGWLANAAPSGAIEPLPRGAKSAFKFGLAAYSLRDRLTSKANAKPAMDLPNFLEYCARIGAGGAELTSYYFPNGFGKEYLLDLKRRAHALGLTLCGGAVRNDFCQPEGPKLVADRAHVDAWSVHYAVLGAPVIRVFAGHTPKGDSESAAVARCARELDAACARAGKTGVMLALENHGGVTRRPETMLEIVRAVHSPWFGVNLDGGNFRDGADPYADLAKIAPYAVNVQLKVDMYRTVAGNTKHERADFNKLASILREAKYSGWIVLEYEAAEDPFVGIPKAFDEMLTAFA
jgi:sugar phosphate isomerase/epimerase